MTNGSPSHSSSQPAPGKKWSKRKRLLLSGGSLLLLVVLVFGVLVAVRGQGTARPDLILHKVKRSRLELTIIERGALEAAKNSEIFCRVKTAAIKPPNIKTLIDDGTEVLFYRPVKEARLIYSWDEAEGKFIKKDGQNPNGPAVVERIDEQTGKKHYADLLLDLEDSALQDQLKSQKTVMDTADLNKFTADETYKDQQSLNVTDIANAKSKLENARFALMKYTGMTRDEILNPDNIAGLKGDIAELSANFGRNSVLIAQNDLVKFKAGDYLALVKDCMGQIENAKSDLSQQEDREAWSYRMAKKGYQTLSQAQAETSRKESYQLTLNKVSLNLENIVKSQKLKDLNTFISDLEEAQRALDRAITHAASLDAQNKKAADIKKGSFEQEKAHYQEILDEIRKCKIAAPQDGLVVYYVPEQARFGGGTQQSIIAQGEPVREGQKLMMIPDLKHMVVITKVHEALISKVEPEQKARIRVDAFGGRVLQGEVDFVANAPAQQDFMSADVKVYPTKITIDDVQGLPLKPGMNAQVTITIDKALENVLTVPIQSIVGGSEMGGQRTVVVMTPAGPVQRNVTVGLSNEKIAEIKEGLEEGDEVVENPKAVLGDKIKVHEPAPEKGFGGKGGKGGKGKEASPKGKMETMNRGGHKRG